MRLPPRLARLAGCFAGPQVLPAATPTSPAPFRVAAGVEVEFKGLSVAQATRVLLATLGGRVVSARHAPETVVEDAHGHHWTVSPDEASTEVASPVLRGPADVERLVLLYGALRRAGAQVDRDTGLHIHRDGKGFGAAAVARLIQMVGAVQDDLAGHLHVDAYRLDNYCRPLPPTLLRDIGGMREATERALRAAYDGDFVGRKRCVNFENRLRGWHRHPGLDTIEYRLFNATLEPERVRGYLALTEALSAAALDGRGLTPPPGWGLDALATLCAGTPAGAGIAAQLRTPAPDDAALNALVSAPMPHLLALVDHPWWQVRAAVATQLGCHAPPPRRALRHLGADEDVRVAREAAHASRWGRLEPRWHSATGPADLCGTAPWLASGSPTGPLSPLPSSTPPDSPTRGLLAA